MFHSPLSSVGIHRYSLARRSFVLCGWAFCGWVLCGMSSQALAQWPSRFSAQAEELLDTDALRSQVLGQWGLPPGFMQPLDPAFRGQCMRNHFNKLGFVSIPLPNYLRSSALGVPDEGGQLITRVAQGSPAALNGLQPGMTIVEIDGELLNSAADLGRLCGPHALLILTDEGMQLVELKSIAANLIDPFSQPEFTGGLRNMELPARSLSISESNGIMAVAAIVDTQRGAQQVELKGTRQQVEMQLQQLTPEVQNALRPHLR